MIGEAQSLVEQGLFGGALGGVEDEDGAGLATVAGRLVDEGAEVLFDTKIDGLGRADVVNGKGLTLRPLDRHPHDFLVGGDDLVADRHHRFKA